MELERLQEQASVALSDLERNQLVEACCYLKCIKDRDAAVKERSRRALIRMAERVLDDIEDKQEEDEACQYVQDFISFIKTLKGTSTDSQASEQEQIRLEELRDKYKQLQQSQEEARKALEGEIKAMSVKLGAGDTDKVSERAALALPLRNPLLPEVTIRREFRIHGQIGEGGQKDKLSYTNLIHQIEAGVRKGHADSEVIDAVIKAVCPGLHLRDMLEIKSDLTLDKLRTILKGHYKEESTSDLYQKLVNISQEPRESAQNFLFRAIELKERLLFASREKGAEEQYDAELIRKKFSDP